MSSRDVTAESSPTAVCLLQPEQAVGDAQSMRSTGDAGSRVQGPPVDRVPQSVSAIQAELPADVNSQQQYAAASQPLELSSAFADVVVPQVQGRAVVQSSADGNQVCLAEDDRQSMTGSQTHASAEEIAPQVQGATADASPQVSDTASKGHAALARSPPVNVESAPANAASAEAAAAADALMASDAAFAIWLQQEEHCKSAGHESGLHSIESMAAFEAELHADIEELRHRSNMRPIRTSYPCVTQEQIYQLQLEQATTESLRQSAVECVGRSKTPLETRAGADKDSPWGRLPHKFSHVRSIKGDGNCFYRAILAGMVEGLCLEPRPARIAALSAAFMSQRVAMESCPIVNHQTKVLALQGHSLLQDMLQGIGRPGKTWQDMLEVLNNQDMDQAMVQFLRAITATQMWANKAKYALYIVAIDAYRGFSYSYDTILQHETLRMTAQAEQMQVTALMAVLPVRLKVLDTAGTQPYSSTVEPDLLLSRPTNSTQAQTAASAADGAAESAQQVWLRYRPGYYEVVYPAQGCEDHDGAM
ncbi:TPA: OTU domain, ubiquitin aldehyde binding [Trebouxia sp. C0005]